MTDPSDSPLGAVHAHGDGPPQVAVLHGGPGGAGEVAPLASGLAQRGIPSLEPHQTALSVDGQVEELRQQLQPHGPMAVLGWSWGAWLGCLLAAAHPDLVSQLILVASAPFREADHLTIKSARQSRLSPAQRDEMATLRAGPLAPPDTARLVHLMEISDSVAPEHEPVQVTFDVHLNKVVWAEAAELRRSGALLHGLAQIQCPITAIHGADDAHPMAGVFEPLRDSHPTSQLHALKQCGHKPWIERHAKAAFYEVLTETLKLPNGEECPSGREELRP